MGIGLLFLGLAAAPGAAMAAAPPVVSTGSATAITGTGATLSGTVDPEGQSTSYQFRFDYANTQWCQSGGATGSATYNTPSTALEFSDSTAHAVSATISNFGLNLTGKSFCFRVEASNAGPSVVGATVGFTTLAMVVRTDPATSIISGKATLNGTLNFQGDPSFYHFDYAPSDSSFCMSGGTDSTQYITPQGSPSPESGDHQVSAVVSGLTPGTSYCFRLATGIGFGSFAHNGTLATFTSAPLVPLAVHVTGNGLVDARETPFDYPLEAKVVISCGGGDPAVARQFTACSVGVAQGRVVTLRASSYTAELPESDAPPARFAGWSGACSGTAPTCTVTMSSDVTVGATFAPLSSSPSPAAVNKGLAAVLAPSGPAANIAAILKTGSYPATFNAPGPGTAQIAWYQATPGARVAQARPKKPALVAKGAKTFTKAGKAKIKIKLTAKGKALLKKVKAGHKLKITAEGSFTPKGGKKTTKQKSFTLKR